MSVEVNNTRKAVEIAWDTAGEADPPEVWPPNFPEHPMDPPVDPPALPPFIWGGGNEPFPGYGLPGDQPEVDGDTDRVDNTFPEGDQNPIGNLPPSVQPVGFGPNGEVLAVQVFAQGQDGDWSNTAILKNDGLAVLTYPADFAGESYVEVRALDGTLVDSGTIQVLG